MVANPQFNFMAPQEYYDPITGQSLSSGSEADISMWIEQSYRN
jgi:hypothetical protein